MMSSSCANPSAPKQRILRILQVVSILCAPALAVVETGGLMPGVPADPIDIDLSTHPPVAKLSGFEARLIAVVSPIEGMWSPSGTSLDSNAIPEAAVAWIEDMRERSKQRKKTGTLTECNFALLMELKRDAEYTDFLSVTGAGSFGLGQGRVYNSSLTDNKHSFETSDPLLVLVGLTLCLSSGSDKVTIKTFVEHGPAFDESFDINVTDLDAPNILLGYKFWANVAHLPDDVPALRQDWPTVALRANKPVDLSGFEVQAILKNGSLVRANPHVGLEMNEKWQQSTWQFGGAERIAKANVAKFVFRGYRVQPIIWRNLTLPIGTKPYLQYGPKLQASAASPRP